MPQEDEGLAVNGLETAIRNALARSDRTNAEMRARIYQSARQALETGLRKQNINDPEILAEQRHRLELLIHAVEQQERAELEAAAVSPPDARLEPSMDIPAQESVVPPDAGDLRAARHDEPAHQTAADAASDFGHIKAERDDWLAGATRAPPPGKAKAPAVDKARARGPGPAEAATESAGEPLDIRPDKIVRKPRRRGFLSRLFIFLILLAGAGTGAWWVYTSGLLLTTAERDTSVPNPPPRAEAEDFTGEAAVPSLDPQQGFSADWISVFEPGQMAEINAHENALVDLVTANDGQAVRITSKSGDSNGEVEIAVPVEVMRDMAGKTSTIALTMQAAGDKPVQITVDCNFDLLGDCARHRFTINPEKLDVLLRVAFDRSLAPSKPGALILNGDISGAGQSVNLYSVRILPGQ